MKILVLTGITSERVFVPPMDDKGNFLSEPQPDEISYHLVFNSGEFRLPVSKEQAEFAYQFLGGGEEQPLPQREESPEELEQYAEQFSAELEQPEPIHPDYQHTPSEHEITDSYEPDDIADGVGQF